MLGFMRKHARSTFIKAIFWMIIIVFMSWGVGVMVSGGNRVNVAASVDGEPITVQAYTRAYEDLHRVYQQVYRDALSPQLLAQLNLHQRALDNLITSLLLRREAARLGLTVDDDEVRAAILGLPTFQSGGRFDRTHYLAVLRATRITPTEFEESQRENLLVGKLDAVLTDGLTVTERELRDLFALEQEKINVAFVMVPAAKHRDAVVVSDEEVADYYEKNQSSFREPERVTMTYVSYTADALRAAVPISDDGIRTYYDAHGTDFETPEKIRVRQILFVLPPDADDTARGEIRAKAEGVLAEAKKGGDFAALARAHSGDPLSAEAGGDLGLVERGKLDAAIEEAAFALEPGQVSEVVESQRGFSILKVEERQAGAVRPLAEVRDEIVRALQERGADQTARDALAADLERARQGATLEEVAAARGLTATTSRPVSRGEPLPGVTGPALVTAALALGPGAVDELTGAEPPYYLFAVKEKTPSTIVPLEEARARIVEALRTRKAKEGARADAEALLEAARAAGGADALATAAKAKGYALEETGPFGRNEAIPKLTGAPIKDELFALAPASPLDPHPHDLPEGTIVVALKERIPPDDSAFADKRDGLRDNALASKRSHVLESYREMLRQRADISVNPDVVTGART